MDTKNPGDENVLTRKISSTSLCSLRTSGSSTSSAGKKAASLTEINDLYSALQGLVNPSPRPQNRSRCVSSVAAPSWSKDDNDPVAGKSRVSRSSSSVTASTRSESFLLERSDKECERRKTGYEKLTDRVRSASSIGISKSAALKKLKEQRKKLKQSFRRADKEVEECSQETDKDPEVTQVHDIDALLEMAKLSPRDRRKDRKKNRKAQRKKFNTLPRQSNRKDMEVPFDPSLTPDIIQSRIDMWYERASAQAVNSEGYNENCSDSDSSSDFSAQLLREDVFDSQTSSLLDFNFDDLLANDKTGNSDFEASKEENRNRGSADVGAKFEVDLPGFREINGPPASDKDEIPMADDKDRNEIAGQERSKTNSGQNLNNQGPPHSKDKTTSKFHLEDCSSSGTILPSKPLFYIPNLSDDGDASLTMIVNFESDKISTTPVEDKRLQKVRNSTGSDKNNKTENTENMSDAGRKRVSRTKNIDTGSSRYKTETDMEEKDENEIDLLYKQRIKSRAQSVRADSKTDSTITKDAKSIDRIFYVGKAETFKINELNNHKTRSPVVKSKSFQLSRSNRPSSTDYAEIFAKEQKNRPTSLHGNEFKRTSWTEKDRHGKNEFSFDTGVQTDGERQRADSGETVWWERLKQMSTVSGKSYLRLLCRG